MILTIVFGVGSGVLMVVKKIGCWTMFWGHFPQWPVRPGFWIAIV